MKKLLLLGSLSTLLIWSADSNPQAKQWSRNGTLDPTLFGFTSTFNSGGSAISTVEAPFSGDLQEIQVKTRLRESGGSYALYLKASSDALLGPDPAGTFYAFELHDVMLSANGCTSTLTLFKRVDEHVTELASKPVECGDGMTIRGFATRSGLLMAKWGSGRGVSSENTMVAIDTSIPSGGTGIGVRSAPPVNGVYAEDRSGKTETKAAIATAAPARQHSDVYPCGSTVEVTSVDSTPSFKMVVYYCNLTFMGGTSGPSYGGAYSDGLSELQREYESGFCTTPQGIPCYEEKRIQIELVSAIQDVLDVAGLVPGVGEVADLANAIIYAAKGDGGNAVLSLAGMLPVGGQITAARVFRSQVLGRLGVDATQAIGKHAHHMLPQAGRFTDYFSRASIDINESFWGTLWDAKDHLSNAYRYNKDWDGFFAQNPTRTVQEISDFASSLATKYGLTWP